MNQRGPVFIFVMHNHAKQRMLAFQVPVSCCHKKIDVRRADHPASSFRVVGLGRDAWLTAVLFAALAWGKSAAMWQARQATL
jgi:hypothetical protein